MRRLAFAILLFAFACHAAAQQPDPKKKSDLELIQGVWRIVGLESGGKKQSDKSFSGNTFTFRKDKKGADLAVLQETPPYPPVDFAYSLDSAKTPKSIDLTTKAGGNKALGIYKLEGDDLTISLSLGGPRPTEFATKAGGDTETFTLKRNRWERYTEKGGGFAVDFPGKPVESKRETVTPDGKITTTVLSLRGEMEHASFTVTITPIPSNLEAKDAEAVLDAAQQTILTEFDKAADAKIESPGRAFKPPNNVTGVLATREFTIAMNLPDSKEKGATRVRLFIAGERLFAQTITGTEDATRAQGVSQFWNTFRVPAGKKKDPPGKE